MAATKTTGQRLALFSRLPVKSLLAPVIGIMKGLTDPMVGLLMGQTAENLAYRFGITRTQQDAFSVRSHQRVALAQDEGRLAPGGGEVEALYDRDGTVYALDDGVRRDASPEGLAKLRPFFDRKYGSVTPGNSSQITDGAAWMLLASEEAVRRHDLAPIGRIVDSEWAGLDPAQMGLGPVHAATPILKRHGLGLDDLDYWEINEAFAAQVLACDRDLAFDRKRLNVNGGAIALGHPIGATGARIVTTLLHEMERRNARLGLATLCVSGGLGIALELERS
jgi:acetyl-CoA C-acetyltransferase